MPRYAAAVATRTTEEMIIAARKAGIEITVTAAPKGTAEIAVLPGVRRPPERGA